MAGGPSDPTDERTLAWERWLKPQGRWSWVETQNEISRYLLQRGLGVMPFAKNGG